MRAFWIAFGAVTQGLFLVVVVALFRFLWGQGNEPAIEAATSSYQLFWSVALDLGLLLQFAVVHSLLLHPTTRRRLEPWIPSAQYGCFFCAVTCLGLLTTTANWRTISPVCVQTPAWGAMSVRAAYIASWAALLFSINLTGLGYQTGFTPWWAWVQGRRPPRRGFEIRSAYRVFRHPIYLSFLGLIWFTPTVTADRMLLDVVWTGYIFLGSWLKDQRLEFYLGKSYRRYRRLAPAYPTPSSLLQLLQGTFAAPRGPIENLAAADSSENLIVVPVDSISPGGRQTRRAA